MSAQQSNDDQIPQHFFGDFIEPLNQLISGKFRIPKQYTFSAIPTANVFKPIGHKPILASNAEIKNTRRGIDNDDDDEGIDNTRDDNNEEDDNDDYKDAKFEIIVSRRDKPVFRKCINRKGLFIARIKGMHHNNNKKPVYWRRYLEAINTLTSCNPKWMVCNEIKSVFQQCIYRCGAFIAGRHHNKKRICGYSKGQERRHCFNFYCSMFLYIYTYSVCFYIFVHRYHSVYCYIATIWFTLE